MKSFNANKVKTTENGACKLNHLMLRLICVCTAAEAIQTKPAAPAEGAVSMSQVAAQAVISKKANGDDSLSPFTSDDENAKPRRKSSLIHQGDLTGMAINFLCFL